MTGQRYNYRSSLFHDTIDRGTRPTTVAMFAGMNPVRIKQVFHENGSGWRHEPLGAPFERIAVLVEGESDRQRAASNQDTPRHTC